MIKLGKIFFGFNHFLSTVFTECTDKKLYTSVKPLCSRLATKLLRAGIENCIKLAVPTTEENLRQQWGTDKKYCSICVVAYISVNETVVRYTANSHQIQFL